MEKYLRIWGCFPVALTQISALLLNIRRYVSAFGAGAQVRVFCLILRASRSEEDATELYQFSSVQIQRICSFNYCTTACGEPGSVYQDISGTLEIAQTFLHILHSFQIHRIIFFVK